MSKNPRAAKRWKPPSPYLLIYSAGGCPCWMSVPITAVPARTRRRTTVSFVEVKRVQRRSKSFIFFTIRCGGRSLQHIRACAISDIDMKEKSQRRRELLRLTLYVALTMPLVISVVYLVLTWNLPKINSITDYRPPLSTRILCEDGSLCGEFSLERRKLVPLREIPKFIRDAFVASEDERFYEHKGIDIVSILRALLKNIAAGEIVQGGSTITQQVTKSLLLSPERSLSRKIKEALLAHRIERRLTKDEILEIYLNQIYLGHGAYGIEMAAETYFGKRAGDLTDGEGAFLAGLPKAPARYSPITHPRRAKV